MKITASFAFWLLLWSTGRALDVEVVQTICDESLPITANLYLQCNNGARCTFGQSATVYGTLFYNGVENSGVENDVAYMTADLSLWALDFNLVDMLKVPICHENLVAGQNNVNDCPGDGEYDYSITYKLPNSGNPASSWLATGWEGYGTIKMFSAQDENMLIGECTLELKTHVTQKSKEKSLLGTPSAAVTAGIILGVAAMVGLLCFYCYCCRRNRAAKPSGKTVVDEDDSYFRRMEEEKSYWSGGASKRSGVKTVVADRQSVVSELP